MRTFYSILNCEKEEEEVGSNEKIKQAYFSLLRKLHPDKSVEPDLDEFILVNKAWAILGNPISREKYNKWLREQRLREAKELIGSEIEWDCSSNSQQYLEEECRCGGSFEAEAKELVKLLVDYALIECSNCSLLLKVHKATTD